MALRTHIVDRVSLGRCVDDVDFRWAHVVCLAHLARAWGLVVLRMGWEGREGASVTSMVTRPGLYTTYHSIVESVRVKAFEHRRDTTCLESVIIVGFAYHFEEETVSPRE